MAPYTYLSIYIYIYIYVYIVDQILGPYRTSIGTPLRPKYILFLLHGALTFMRWERPCGSNASETLKTRTRIVYGALEVQLKDGCLTLVS